MLNMGPVSLGWASGAPPTSETGLPGWAGIWNAPCAWASLGPPVRSPGERGGQEGRGDTSLHPASLHPTQASPRVPSPIRVWIHAVFSRCLHWAQLTCCVVYWPSRPLLPPPACRPPAWVLACPSAFLSACSCVRASAERGPERSGPRAKGPGCSAGI